MVEKEENKTFEVIKKQLSILFCFEFASKKCNTHITAKKHPPSPETNVKTVVTTGAAEGATPEPPVPESIQGVYGLVVGKDAQKDITIQDLFKDGMRSIDEVHNDSTFYVFDNASEKYLKFNKSNPLPPIT